MPMLVFFEGPKVPNWNRSETCGRGAVFLGITGTNISAWDCLRAGARHSALRPQLHELELDAASDAGGNTLRAVGSFRC